MSEKKEIKNEFDFKGEYIAVVGRRKTSVARVRLYKKGKGTISVNDQKANDYFHSVDYSVILQPIKLTSHLRDLDFSVSVKGGGIKGQLEAVRHGISRALLAFDEANREIMKVNGFLTRDPRKKERKKPGLKKARKAPQWSKR